VTHSPLVAKSGEQITFTAKSFEIGPPPDSRQIQILVDGAVVKECDYSPCQYKGGPYGVGYLQYAANVETVGSFLGNPINATHVDGYYHTEITGRGYSSSNQYIRGRIRSIRRSTFTNVDMVFHMADDYAATGANFSDFINDATNKVQDVLGSQDLIEQELDHLNFWVYKREASASGCGTVHSLAASEITFSDVDAVLHVNAKSDCTSGTHFSAEGSDTKAFLHEAAHALIDLGDEYSGITCYSCVGSPEQNIFETEAACQAEQTLKGRNPSTCWKFTSSTSLGDWWGIHTGTTVMTTGNVGNPWGIEAAERVNWYFEAF